MPWGGSFSCPDPGSTYRLSNFKTGTQRYRDFTVKSGETLDLGDFVIENPQAK